MSQVHINLIFLTYVTYYLGSSPFDCDRLGKIVLVCGTPADHIYVKTEWGLCLPVTVEK